ncbi:phage tail assembly chaperone [Yersinia alsatica]|uniref:phage tail assembly chaperone n=1 Tax=Yersinia alsatica TaxID=2890317 RepID=UPI0005DC7A21|nr:putative tail fiber assembly protein [Yersinia frederiksenii]
MMNTYYWSAKNNAFFPMLTSTNYEKAGWDLSDAIEVNNELFNTFTDIPAGKERTVDNEGMPCFIDAIAIVPPELTPDELAATARRYRDAFIIATDCMMVSDYCIDDTPLTEAQRTELLAIRSNYRAWPTQENWPLIELPEIPQWLLIEAVNQGYRVSVWPQEV